MNLCIEQPRRSPPLHDGDATPPSTEAKRALRLLRENLDARATALIQAADRVPVDLLKAVRFRTARGRDIAMSEILRRMPVPPLNVEKRSAIWRLLAIERDAIEVQGLGFDARAGGWVRRSFGLSFSAHAILRLYDRSGFRQDAEQSMLQAHTALLSLSPSEGEELFGLRSIALPGITGLFLCSTRPQMDESEPAQAIASTWVHQEQLWDDQENYQGAWDKLLSL